MSYCINPNCIQRLNPEHIDRCKACGTPLMVHGCYRLTRPLRSLERSRYVEVFEIEDGQSCCKVLKILKARHEELIELFIKEAKVLSWLEHPGIPKVEPGPNGYFHLSSAEDVDLHCIVMEKIEGQTLSQWLTQYKKLSSVDLTLKWLKDLTQILEQVHDNKLFHRDIKPSNIICRPNGQLTLIDFGAVNQVTAALDNRANLPNILTPGYAPPEQFDGQAVPQSDFFALGRTFIHLLTGQHPIDLNEVNGQLIWHPFSTANLPPLLIDLIDDLTHLSINDRPGSTTEIQQRLDHIFHSLLDSSCTHQSLPLSPLRLKKEWYFPTRAKTIFLLTISLVVGLIYGSQFQNQRHREAAITVGETTLLPGTVPPEKQKGMDAIVVGEFANAVKHFKASLDTLQYPNDPETRIFLNNARIGSQKSYTIAVSVPVTCSANRIKNIKLTNRGSLDITLRILKGAGTAQAEINRLGGIKNIPLKIAIACSNDQDDATLVAKEIISRPEILGVVGTPPRKAAQAAEKLYCGNIVSLAPNSDSIELDNCDRYTFRMLPSDSTTAKTLSKYMLTVQQRRKAIIFYTSKNLHSQSLEREFEQSTAVGGGKILDRIDFAAPGYNAKKFVELATSKDAEVLVLFPDGHTLNKAIEVINANRQRLHLLAGAKMFSLVTLAKTQQNSLGMITEAPCHDNKEDPDHWRYVIAYESIQALSAALRQVPSRAGIRTALSSSSFQAKGICEPVRFSPSGDRNTKVQLMEILPGQKSGTGYDFHPLPGF